jgi:mycofactocin precursor peptide peptidase
MQLRELATPAVPVGATLVVAAGSVEQHGPHLPLDTDLQLAESAVRALVTARPWLVNGPAVPYGASGEHEGAPGTVSIGTEALTLTLIELARSAPWWASRVLFVNGHGGNRDALARAAVLARSEGRDVTWWTWQLPEGHAHAGHVETAMLLDLSPHLIQMDLAEPGDLRPLHELLPELRRVRVGVSPSGILGDPTDADASDGAAMLAALGAELLRAFDRWSPDVSGRVVGGWPARPPRRPAAVIADSEGVR